MPLTIDPAAFDPAAIPAETLAINAEIVRRLNAEPEGLTVQEIRGIFRKLGLEPRIVGPVPNELNPKSKTQPIRVG